MRLRALAFSTARRFYRRLIGLCPKRDLLDPEELLATFEEALKHESQTSGAFAAFQFCLGAYLDTLAFAGAGWMSRIRRSFHLSLPTSREQLSMAFPSFHRAFRVGIRSLSKTPLVSAVAVSTVALAVGITTVILSLVYGTTLRPLPFPDGERIHSVELLALTDEHGVDFEALELRDFRERQDSFERLEGYFQRRVTLQSGAGHALGLDAAVVTAGALDHLGTPPLLGRTFLEGEDFTEAIQHVVLGFDVWQRHLGGRRDVLGTVVQVDGRALEIIGVMPEGFRFPAHESLWIPMDFDLPVEDRGSGRSFRVFGRLEHDRTAEQAEREAQVIAAGIAAENPDFHVPLTAQVRPFVQSHLPEGLDRMVGMLLAAVAGVLLIAGANVVNLLVGRAVLRSGETTVRTALGAGRADIGALFVAESLILSTAGALVGCGAAVLGTTWLQQQASRLALPYWAEVRLDPAVWVAVAALSVLLGVGVGVLASRLSLPKRNDSIQQLGRDLSSRRAGRIGRYLVTVQIAVSCALLIGAGLLLQSLRHANAIELGFDAQRVMTADVRLPRVEFPTADSRSKFYLEFLEQAPQLAGVSGAAWVRSPPGTGPTFSWSFRVEGAAMPSEAPTADGVPISHGYFDVLDIPLLQGRDFLPEESRAGHPPAVIVNRTFADRHLGTDAVGRRLKLSDDPGEPWLPIVGVVEDSHIGTSSGGIGLTKSKREQIFVSWGVAPFSRATLLVRAATESPSAVAPQTRELVSSVAPGVSLDEIAELDRIIADSTWAFGLFGSLFGVFGGVALILSIIGLYGVTAFIVSRRTRELGVRIALGATRARLWWLVLRSAARQLGVGISVGLLLGYTLAGSFRALLFGVGILDLTVYGTIAVILATTGLGAAFLSTAGIGRIAPAEVLKS
ncbi:MAG: ABC transporter permease [Thermoanaerobaculia bacterium]|nr:ABC transporter permease [Thermoanaerobaculia bacterium]